MIPMSSSPYQLPDGRIVPIHDDVARGASWISFTLVGGKVVEAVRCPSTPDIETALMTLHQSSDGLRQDLDRLAIQVERLIRERAHIIDVLSHFYHSDITMSSLQPVLDLCCELNPSLREKV